jgi:hypothetical protein
VHLVAALVVGHRGVIETGVGMQGGTKLERMAAMQTLP